MKAPIRISLFNPPLVGLKKYRKQFTFGIVITSLLVIAQTIYINQSLHGEIHPAIILFYCIYPAIALWEVKKQPKLFIEISDKHIVFKQSVWAGTIRLHANEIKFIDIDITNVFVLTHDQRSFMINLSNAQTHDIETITKTLTKFVTRELSY